MPEKNALQPTEKAVLKKIDLHSHTAGVSFCSAVSADYYAMVYKNAGIRTTLLTNHYARRQMELYANTFDEQMVRFFSEYLFAKQEGAKAGIRVLLGAEVAIEHPGARYIEFLLFGLTPGFLFGNPNLYDLTQKELYKKCNDNNILMYQTHPFRAEHGQKPGDPEYMDGVEINCHPYFNNCIQEVLHFADKYRLGISCGSDLHYVQQAGNGGIFVPPEVTSEQALARFLKENKRPKIFMNPKLHVKL